MEDDAIMLPSGCALACVSLVFGIKGEFHQKTGLHFYSKGFSDRNDQDVFLTGHIRFEIGGRKITKWWNFLPHLHQESAVLDRKQKYSRFQRTQTWLALQVDFVRSHSSSWEHMTARKPVFVIKASPFWWNGPLMWSRQLFLLPESHPHTPAETPTRAPLGSSISIHLLDCLTCTKRNLYDRLI